MEAAKPLFQVLEPVKKEIGGSMFGSTQGYKMPGK